MAGSEISLSAGEQSDGMEQISQAVSPFDQLTQENAAIVEQTAAARATGSSARHDGHGGRLFARRRGASSAVIAFAPVCRRAAPVFHQ